MLVNSLPLSLTTIFGLPRSITSRSSTRATRVPESEVSATSLAGAIIDEGGDTESTAIGELIRYEVKRPAAVRRHRHHRRRPGPDRPLAPATAAHRKPLFPVEPERFLVV